MTERSIGAFMRGCCVTAAVLVAAGMLFTGCGKGKQEEATTAPAVMTGEAPAMPSAPPTFAANLNSKVCVVDVDGKKLLEGDVQEQMDRLLMSRSMDGLPPAELAQERAKLRETLIDRFVAQQVLLKEADKQAMTADPAEVTRMIDDIKTRTPQGVPFEEFLVSCGTSLAELTEDVRNELRIEKLVAAQTSSVPAATEEDARTFYNEQPAYFEAPETVRARHVLVGCSPDATDATKAEKKAKAEGIRKRLVEGADFAEVAKADSDCNSKERGGDLGEFSRGQMVKEFETAAFEQATNAISPLVETRFGYHIIQVLEHNAAGKKPFDDVKTQIMEFLARKKQQEAISLYIESLKKNVQITYGEKTAATGGQPDKPLASPAAN